MTALVPLQPVSVPPIAINLGSQAVLVKLAADAAALAKSMEIDSLEMAEQAQAEITTWCRERDEIEAWRKGITKPLDEAKKIVMDFVRPAVDGLTNAEGLLKQKVAAWQRAERERAERERREAEERARQERLRHEAEAREKERQAREAAEAAAAKARAAQETQDAESRAQLEREAAEAARVAEEQLHEAAASTAVAQVIVAAPVQEAAKVAGFRFTEKVELRVANKVELVQWVAANIQFVDLLDVDMAALKALHKAMKDRFNVPGVEVTKDLGAGRATRAA